MEMVERCQGFVGDAICDGGSIELEHKKLLHDQSLEELQKMTSSELESYELKRMQYNAFKVCEEAVSQVDGAPGPGGISTHLNQRQKKMHSCMIKSSQTYIFRRVKKKDLHYLVLLTTKSLKNLWKVIVK